MSCSQPRYSAKGHYTFHITARFPRLSSLTKSIALPPRQKGGLYVHASGSYRRYCCRSFLCCSSLPRCSFNGSPPQWAGTIGSGKQLVRSDKTNPDIVGQGAGRQSGGRLG